jgi:LuxR family transcriptional regulator, maltose regulon positive regulatory protein
MVAGGRSVQSVDSAAWWAPRTKLTPPAISDEVVVAAGLRHRAVDLIRDNRLTLVVAQGGSGKTTVVRAATDALGWPVAWLRLHEADDDPRMLVELLAAAVDHATAGASTTTLDLVASGRSRDLAPTQLLGVLLDELEEQGPLVLVVEDLHRLEAAPTLDALAYLLEFAPPALRVVATSRRPPELPLARLRSRAGVGELGADDLRIDDATARAILSRRGLEPDPGRVTELLELTNGWIAGFLLAATASATTSDGPGAPPAVLAEYLAEEIVAAEPPRTQQLLRAVSILDELDPQRCATVSGLPDAADVIDDLHARLGYLMVDHEGRLRFHDLFADHLRDELRRHTDDEERRELHLRAAATATSERDRIDHLLLAGDAEHEAAAAIEALARSSDRHPSLDAQLVAWIDRLSPAVRAERPWLDLVVGVAAANDLAGDTAGRVLASVIERAEAHDDFELRWLAVSAMGRATHDFERWMPELARLEHDPRFDELPAPIQVEWLIGAAWGALWAGDLDGSRERVEAAIDLHRRSGSLAAAESLALHLGFPLATWPGALDDMEAHHRSTLAEHGERSWVVRLGAGAQLQALAAIRGVARDLPPPSPAEAAITADVPYFAIAHVFTRAARARWAGDHHTLHGAVSPALDRPGFATMLAPALAASYRDQGLTAELDALLAGLRSWAGGPPGRPAMTLVADIVAAEAAWGRGDLDDAEHRLDQACADHGPLLIAPVLDPGCELALVRAEQGRAAAAAATLSERLDDLVGRLASPGRVAQSGPALLPLLEHLDADGHPHAATVRELLQQPGSPTPRRVPTTGEVLTPREVEVLRRVADGASNAELAETLHVSINTVKTHVKRVLSKLGTSSRAEAAAVARQQHLL